MTDEEIPLVIQPRRIELVSDVIASCPVPPIQPKEIEQAGTAGEVSDAPGSVASQQWPEVRPGHVAAARIEAEGSEAPADIPPLQVAPTGVVRPIEDTVPAVGPPGHAGVRRGRPSWSWPGWLLLALLLVLLALWLAREVVSWAGTLATFHPVLGHVLYAAVAGLLALGLLTLYGQYRAYLRLESLDDLRMRLGQAQRLQVSKAADEQLRQAFGAYVEKLATAQAILPEMRRPVLGRGSIQGNKYRG